MIYMYICVYVYMYICAYVSYNLFVVVLRPNNIQGHFRMGTDLRQCTLMATS